MVESAHSPDVALSRLPGLVLRWSMVAAVVVLVGGAIISRDPEFVASFAVAAGLDIGTFSLIAHRPPEAAEAGNRLGLAFAVRLILKAIVLVAAVAIGPPLHFAAVAMGVLVVDTTLMFGGASYMATHVIRDRQGGR